MRHGEVDYFDEHGRPQRPEAVPLNGPGREQARAAGLALAEVAIDRAITSGLPRSEQTANLVLAGRPVPEPIATPSSQLWAMTLPAPGLVPPISMPSEPNIAMPLRWLASAALPEASMPM